MNRTNVTIFISHVLISFKFKSRFKHVQEGLKEPLSKMEGIIVGKDNKIAPTTNLVRTNLKQILLGLFFIRNN